MVYSHVASKTEALVVVCVVVFQQSIVILCAVVPLVVSHLNVLLASPFSSTKAILPPNALSDLHCPAFKATGTLHAGLLTSLPTLHCALPTYHCA